MTGGYRANGVRALLVVLVLGGALAAGLAVKLPWFPAWGGPAEDRSVAPVAVDDFGRLVADEKRLVVVNMFLDGDRDAESLAATLAGLEAERTFGDRVVYAGFDVERSPALAQREGVDSDKFVCQLNFYSKGKRLGVLRDETDPKVVEETIRRYLDGMVKRYGPGWLPDVRGMQRTRADQAILPIQPADSTKTSNQ